jgi:hypothetical protein
LTNVDADVVVAVACFFWSKQAKSEKISKKVLGFFVCLDIFETERERVAVQESMWVTKIRSIDYDNTL